ncbi:MAG: polyprenyl synthetase family protein [Myxococcales bacterium]|nr:polyprenyl synthetase family protein [Myxococcales bacterium]
MTNQPNPPTLSLELAPAPLRAYVVDVARWIDDELTRRLAVPSPDPGRLGEAMLYAATSPGKRLRPAVLVAACEALGAPRERALTAATAVELLHAYTLVHDDLPAMDDDDERRGRPTVHIAFGEATAILAGDGLLTLAFELLGELGPAAGAAVTVLARRAGHRELLLGQALDLSLTTQGAAPSLEELELLHAGKTGALFSAAAELGGICAGASAAQRAALAEYGMAIGIAFQHADDRDDAEFMEHAAASAARMRQLCARAQALAAELAPHSLLDEIARWIGSKA